MAKKKSPSVRIRKEEIFGKQAYVVLKNGKPTEFRYTKKGAENLKKKIKEKMRKK